MEKNQNFGYTILHSTKTITISRAFEKKTNTVDSPEYKVLLKLMHDFGHVSDKPCRIHTNPTPKTEAGFKRKKSLPAGFLRGLRLR